MGVISVLQFSTRFQLNRIHCSLVTPFECNMLFYKALLRHKGVNANMEVSGTWEQCWDRFMDLDSYRRNFVATGRIIPGQSIKFPLLKSTTPMSMSSSPCSNVDATGS